MASAETKRLRIIVVEPRGEGGMIHYAYQLCNALADAGADISLVTSTDYELTGLPHHFEVIQLLRLWKTSKPNPAPQNRLIQIGYRLFRSIRRAYRGLKYIFEWCRLALYLDRTKPDLIQFGKIEFAFEALFLRWLNRRGNTLTQICHEFELRERSGSLLSDFLNKQYNSVFQNFSMLFFHAKNNKQRFISLFGMQDTPMVVIPLGNEEMFHEAGIDQALSSQFKHKFGLTENNPVVLFFGLIAPSKGLENLIDAFSLVYSTLPNVRLVIAGSPSKYVDMNDYHYQVEHLSLQEAVIFDSRYIPIEEVGALMDLAAVVAFPYTSSTQSASLQVAYSFGKPVVATNVGGLPEAVDDHKSGLIVPPGDNQKMAAALLTLLQNPQSAAEMGRYAKTLSETRFS